MSTNEASLHLCLAVVDGPTRLMGVIVLLDEFPFSFSPAFDKCPVKGNVEVRKKKIELCGLVRLGRKKKADKQILYRFWSHPAPSTENMPLFS